MVDGIIIGSVLERQRSHGEIESQALSLITTLYISLPLLPFGSTKV
jgi:hypothetical protein